MNKNIGIVEKVFIPNNDINSKLIGFKVLINNKLSTIIKNQDEFNCEILKNDIVLITKKIKNGEEFFGIELYDGESYE